MQDKDLSRLKRFYRVVAPAFNIVGKILQYNYRKAFPDLLAKVTIDKNTSVLDVGTGTGGLASLFLEYTPLVTGIDFSSNMLAVAKKKYGDKITFIQKAAHDLKDFTDGQFDLVTGAFTLHDMNNSYRIQVLKEMHRIAGRKVIIFDFIKNSSKIIQAVEYMEGSFYHDFVDTIDGQLAEIFSGYEKLEYHKTMGLYICDL